MILSGRRTRAAVVTVGIVAAAMIPATNALAGSDDGGYRVTNLVSDIPGLAQVTDPNLVNAWGLAAGPATPIWVANNGSDNSTLYRGAVGGTPVSIVPLVVGVPGGAPTGVVFNGGGGFVVSSATASGSSLFIFASEAGDITGWNPAVPPPAFSTQAQPAVHTAGAVYKGLALATTGKGARLYATTFHAGTVDVFDANFAPVATSGGFHDPKLPKGYAPFDVAVINSNIYVTYAKQNAAAHDDVKGRGHGFIDVYDTDGHLLHRLVSRGRLNSPWGLAVAPKGFGRFSGDLLVGNFGDGRINAYDATTGHFRGTLGNGDEHPINIDGLWGLKFGNATIGGPTTLLFSAGPNGETHGLFGAINDAPEGD